MRGAAFGDVAVSFFMAGAASGDVAVSLFVAGAIFGEVPVSLFVADGGVVLEYYFVQSSTGIVLCSTG